MFRFFNPDQRTAVSARTLNTLTPFLRMNPDQVYRKLVKYVDDVAELSSIERGKCVLTASEIKLRAIQVAIPAGTTAEQMQHVDAAIRYGRSQGIHLIVRKTK